MKNFTDLTVISAPSSPSNLSTATLIGSDNSNNEQHESGEDKGKNEKNEAKSSVTLEVKTEPPEKNEILGAPEEPELPKKAAENELETPPRGQNIAIEIDPADENSKGESNSFENLLELPGGVENSVKGSKKEKSRDLKSKYESKDKFDRPAGRFSDGLLTIDSKFRRYRSKIAERRSRPAFKRKGSEGVIVISEMKRKGSDCKSYL